LQHGGLLLRWFFLVDSRYTYWNGIVYVDDEIVPEGMEDLAREGADACPQAAIKLVSA